MKYNFKNYCVRGVNVIFKQCIHIFIYMSAIEKSINALNKQKTACGPLYFINYWSCFWHIDVCSLMFISRLELSSIFFFLIDIKIMANDLIDVLYLQLKKNQIIFTWCKNEKKNRSIVQCFISNFHPFVNILNYRSRDRNNESSFFHTK